MEWIDIIIFGGSFTIMSITILIIKFKKDQKKPKNVNTKMNIDDTIKTMSFFNNVLELKFKYYLNAHFIAYFVNDKDLDKKDIKKFKNDFYIDVSNMLCDDQKQQLLKVFSKQGIELYIHQTFLSLLNEYNIKFQNSNSGNVVDDTHARTLQAIYKGD